MKKKRGNLELYIIASIIILSLLYLVLKRSDKVHYKVPELEKIGKEGIMKVEIIKGDRIVKLENRKGGWVVGEDAFEPDMDLIEKVKNTISNLKLTTLVSKSGNYFKYELDKKRRIHIKVYSFEGKALEFYVGKEAATYGHTHVQIEGDTNIYHCSGSIKRDLDKTIDDLRDKKVFSFDKESITEITFVHNGKTHLLTKFVLPVKKVEKGENKSVSDSKVETEWKYDNNKIEISKINPILNSLADLKCDQYVYSEIELKGSEPFFSIRLAGTENNEIKVYKKDDEKDDKSIVETSQSKYKFYLKKYRVENFLNPLKEIVGIKEK